jgi:hypothetical protein
MACMKLWSNRIYLEFLPVYISDLDSRSIEKEMQDGICILAVPGVTYADLADLKVY